MATQVSGVVGRRPRTLAGEHTRETGEQGAARRELDYRWAPASAIIGTAGFFAYIAVAAIDPAPALAVLLSFAFAFGITVSSIGLYHILGGSQGSPLLLIAAVANVVAASQLLAMLMIQIAVTATVGHDSQFKVIWLALDVSWDLYIGAGTVLLGLAMLLRRQLGAWLSLSGIAVGGALLVLNIATFPTPPVNAGLVDLGPVIGLWYLVLYCHVGISSVLAKRRMRRSIVS